MPTLNRASTMQPFRQSRMVARGANEREPTLVIPPCPEAEFNEMTIKKLRKRKYILSLSLPLSPPYCCHTTTAIQPPPRADQHNTRHFLYSLSLHHQFRGYDTLPGMFLFLPVFYSKHPTTKRLRSARSPPLCRYMQ
jgi:hypothetical protein